VVSQNQEMYGAQEEKPLHHYRTEIPKCIHKAGLDTYEFRAYSEIKCIAGDGGKCFKSLKKIAEDCGMSIDKLRKVLNSLTEVNEFLGVPLLIKIPTKTESGADATTVWKIVDVWPLNSKLFNKKQNMAPIQQNLGMPTTTLPPMGRVVGNETRVVGNETRVVGNETEAICQQDLYKDNKNPIKKEPYKQQQRAHEDDPENPNRDLLLLSKKSSADQQPQKQSPPENPIPDKPTPKNYSAMFFTDSRGKKQQVYEEDVYRHFLKSNFPTEIIAKAIEEAKSTEIVNNPLRFIEGICHNMMQPRNLRKISMDIEVSKKAEERRQRDERTKKILEETKDERKSRFVYVDGRLTIERIN
jgi:hypothetical protein